MTNTDLPTRIYSSFDEFFHEFALKNNVNLSWKESIKKHLKASGHLADQSKWLEGLKHFGL